MQFFWSKTHMWLPRFFGSYDILATKLYACLNFGCEGHGWNHILLSKERFSYALGMSIINKKYSWRFRGKLFNFSLQWKIWKFSQQIPCRIFVEIWHTKWHAKGIGKMASYLKVCDDLSHNSSQASHCSITYILLSINFFWGLYVLNDF